ncbi:2-oxo acid dehydrogenase subunit E2 [Streptomyces qinzhouensis]|uniref:2-oxo acid dehydrogenase subunit E2 n=1 Tax=Streptomyces qinzhouensis TaxID=2599401 RepID=A0A5B8IS36_9ACTN|nr:2-oxo acid dehydrogenase subunit E2 [Streptomyces qinzhouensis]QDY80459.1 2-oxo acid dehydrogenase subunit E2 [Streptomyces qinzhouensis]
MAVTRVARERRHTVYFLNAVRDFAPVHLDTEVDMTAVRRHRRAARAAGRRYSPVAYVLHAAGRALAERPEANAAVRGRIWPRLARYDSVAGKLALDRTLGGRRVVLATVVPELERATLDAIQRRIDRFRDGDPETLPEFAGVRRLHRLPALVAPLAYHVATRPLRGRDRRTGTFSVSSLGHGPVDGFHSVGGTTVTLGVGRILDRPVVRDGAVTVAPVLRLNLTFDHRVIDGAEATDLLAAVKDGLEAFPPDETADPAPNATDPAAATDPADAGGQAPGSGAAGPVTAEAPAARPDRP